MPCCECKKKKKRYEWISEDEWVCINCFVELQRKKINSLRKGIQKYYMAVYDAQGSVDWSAQNRVICVTTLCGHEEKPVVTDAESMKRIIMDLPLLDYGC